MTDTLLRRATIAYHLATFTEGYADAWTLAAGLEDWDAAIDAHGLRGNLDVVTLPNGRLQFVLAFDACEDVPPEAIMLAHWGMPLYQHRADGLVIGA